jgi:ubiquinone/menaquinone biosynthesis C-methylase UbiE
MSNMDGLKGQQQRAWGAGDYAKIGQKLVIVSELLCETIDIRGGNRVLDVATGNGNAALAAARRNCDVTGLDFSETLLEQARQRADAEHLVVDFQEGDAENLPFPDGSFDVVLSSFGVAFTPDHQKSSSEMLRVCRPGGKIGLANWALSEFTQAFDGAMAAYRPPSDLPSPWLWGDADHLNKLFGDAVSSLEIMPRKFTYRYRAPEDYFDEFQTYYGPIMLFYNSLDKDAQEKVKQGLVDATHQFNVADDGTLVLPLDYVETVAVKA